MCFLASSKYTAFLHQVENCFLKLRNLTKKKGLEMIDDMNCKEPWIKSVQKLVQKLPFNPFQPNLSDKKHLLTFKQLIV